jgi:hypothetical protein
MLAGGASVAAVRAACAVGPLDACTGVWIEAEYGCRVDLVGAWGSLPVEDRPDFAGVNLSEDGAVERCAVLIEAGAGVEAGLWSLEDSQLL